MLLNGNGVKLIRWKSGREVVLFHFAKTGGEEKGDNAWTKKAIVVKQRNFGPGQLSVSIN